MVRYISIFFATVLATILLFPANGRTIREDNPAVEPDEKQNQPKYLLVQISEPTKGKSRQLAGTLAQAGIAIGQAIFCKGQSQAQAGTSTNQGQAAPPNQGQAAPPNQGQAAPPNQGQAAAPNQGQAAAIAQGRTFGDLGGLGKALFC